MMLSYTTEWKIWTADRILEWMIRTGFLDVKSRRNLIELTRDGLAADRLARRTNALVLLDDGMSCEAITKVLLLDDDTIRTWYRLYEEDGIEEWTNFSKRAALAVERRATGKAESLGRHSLTARDAPGRRLDRE